MTVHTVVFDAGLTLLRVEPSWLHVFVRAASAAGARVSLQEVQGREGLGHLWAQHDREWRAAGEPDPHVGDTEAERRFWEGLYRRFLAELDIGGDHGELAAAIHDAFLEPGTFRPYPEVPDVLDDLEGRGVALGLLSNWGPWLRDVLEHEGLAARFASVVISGEEGVAKPDLEIFRRALARLGVRADPGVAYVGDDLEADVVPSRQLGITSVLVDRRDGHADHDGPRVVDLSQLSEVLDLPDPVEAASR